MTETEQAAMARTYVNTGWSVFPVWWVRDGRCACPDGGKCTSPGKHPIVRRGVHDASRDPNTVATFWARWPEANIGLPAGGNGLAVLDIDPRHGGVASLNQLGGYLAQRGTPLPSTLTAVTGSGGYHLIYEAPPEGVKGGANVFGPDMPGLDTRGRGGYVVAPPSRHVSGGMYRWLNFFAGVHPWPAVLSLLIDPPTPAGGTAMPSAGAATGPPAEAYAAAALAGEVDRVHAAPEGTRNHTVNRAAFALGQLVASGALPERLVEDELVAAGMAVGLSVTETRATVRSGLRGGARHPRAQGTTWAPPWA